MPVHPVALIVNAANAAAMIAAMGAVLIPLVLPEVMDALHAVIRSINSLG